MTTPEPRVSQLALGLASSSRRAAADRDRARVEGPAAAVGPPVPPDVLVPRELPGGPRPRLHRPLLAPRRRRPRPVLRPRHDAAPGVRRGPDRRRQRPQPVRPPADRGEGRAGDPGRGGDPARGAAARLGAECGRLARPSPARVVADPDAAARWSRAPARGAARADGVEPVPAEVALAFHPRTLAQLLFVRTSLRPRRPDRPVPRRRADRASSTARARATCRRSCRTRSAWRRATSAISRRGPAFPLAGARRLRRPRAQARPPVPPAAAADRAGSRCSATPATPRRRARAALRAAACRTGRGSS